MRDRSYNYFMRIILLLTSLGISLMLIGAFIKFSSLMIIFLSIVVFSGLIISSRCILSYNKQKLISGLLFAFMASVFLFLFVFYSPRPNTDSYDDLDTAYYISLYGPVGNDMSHAGELSVFGNNYFFILFFSYIFRIFSQSNAFHVARSLNFLAVYGTAVITYLCVLSLRDIKRANLVLFLIAINPLFYCIGCWVYTLSFSLLFMMFSLYMLIMIHKTKKTAVSLICALLLGLTAALCYEIRPTALFFLIAAGVLLIFKGLTKENLKRSIISAIVFASALAAGELIISHYKTLYFGELSDMNFPVLYWLMMGSHGNGDLSTNDGDFSYMLEIVRDPDRNRLLLTRIFENFRSNGLTGNLRLFAVKTVNTWSDGYSSLDSRFEYGYKLPFIHDFIAGNRKDLFASYCRASRIVSLAFSLILCLREIKAGKTSLYRAMMVTVLFGGTVFYMLWEAKDIYSAAFLMVLIILSSEGLYESSKVKSFKGIRIVYCLSSLAFLITAVSLFASVGVFERSIIDSTSNYRRDREIDWSGEGELVQSFMCNERFNRIEIPVEYEEGSDISYIMEFSSALTAPPASYEVKADDIVDGVLVKDVDCSGYQGCILKIRKASDESADLTFFTEDAYHFYPYSGKLSYDGRDDIKGVLNMDLSFTATQRYLPTYLIYVFIVAYIIILALLLVADHSLSAPPRKIARPS